MADEAAELQLCHKNARTERKRLKNIRIQPIPLAQTPKVSNVRRYRGRHTSRLHTTTQGSLWGFAPNPPYQIESPQVQQTSSSPGATSVHVVQVDPPVLPDRSYSPQLGPSDSVSNRGDSPVLSTPYFTTIHHSEGSPTSRDLSVVSEPYWSARSDLASTYTIQTAWTPTGRSTRPTITMCYLADHFVSRSHVSHFFRLNPCNNFVSHM